MAPTSFLLFGRYYNGRSTPVRRASFVPKLQSQWGNIVLHIIQNIVKRLFFQPDIDRAAVAV